MAKKIKTGFPIIIDATPGKGLSAYIGKENEQNPMAYSYHRTLSQAEHQLAMYNDNLNENK